MFKKLERQQHRSSFLIGLTTRSVSHGGTHFHKAAHALRFIVFLKGAFRTGGPYQTYNEATFEAYCKTSIDRAIRKGRIEQVKRTLHEVSLSSLTDTALCSLRQDLEFPVGTPIVFRVNGASIPVCDQALGEALFALPPKLRNVLLLSYFLDMSDPQIAARLHTSKSAVQRRRVLALQRLKETYDEESALCHHSSRSER